MRTDRAMRRVIALATIAIVTTTLAAVPCRSAPSTYADVPAVFHDILSDATAIESYRMQSSSPIDDAAIVVDRLGSFEAIEAGRVLGKALRQELVDIFADPDGFTGETKECEFDPTVGYRILGPSGVAEVVICHGCDTVWGTVDGDRFILEITPGDHRLQRIAERLFPRDERLVDYRRREALGYLHPQSIEAIEAYLVGDRGEPGDAAEVLSRFGDYAIVATRVLTAAQREALIGLLSDGRHFGLEAKPCIFEPTVGYRIRLDHERELEVVICHGCNTLYARGPWGEGGIEIDPSAEAFRDLARALFPEATRLEPR